MANRFEVDGSNQFLRINSAGLSPLHLLRYYDDGASVCGTALDGVPLHPALGVGLARRSGDTITGPLAILGLSSRRAGRGGRALQCRWGA